MTGKRLFIYAVFLLLLPLIVARFGISVPGAVALVVFALACRWIITLSGILAPEKTPELELETIAASHFVEKVRWCMDRLGVEYEENQWVGVLGVFTMGRSVPELKIRTGLVRSTSAIHLRFCVICGERTRLDWGTRPNFSSRQRSGLNWSGNSTVMAGTCRFGFIIIFWMTAN